MPSPNLTNALAFLGGGPVGLMLNQRRNKPSMAAQYNQPGQQQQKQQSGIGEVFLGSPAQEKQWQRFNPEQQQAFSQILQNAMGGLSQNQFSFAPIEQQAREGFAQRTVPSIAERFTSLGAQKSSAFPQLLSQAGANLETNLAAMKQNYGLDQQKLLQSLLALGLTPQFDNTFLPRQRGILELGAQGALSALPYLFI